MLSFLLLLLLGCCCPALPPIGWWCKAAVHPRQPGLPKATQGSSWQVGAHITHAQPARTVLCVLVCMHSIHARLVVLCSVKNQTHTCFPCTASPLSGACSCTDHSAAICADSPTWISWAIDTSGTWGLWGGLSCRFRAAGITAGLAGRHETHMV